MTWLSGEIKTWNEERGFGFIKPKDGGRDVFLHISELRRGSAPQVGGTVFFHLTEGQDGKLRACDAYLEGQRPQRGTAARFGFLKFGLVILPFVLSYVFFRATGNTIPGIVYVTMSVVTVLAYIIDKRRALNQQWRIPESLLHSLELCGGWPGALVAQHKLNHKSKKTAYQVLFVLIIVLHALAWGGYYLVGNGFMQQLTAIMASPTAPAAPKPVSDSITRAKTSQVGINRKQHSDRK